MKSISFLRVSDEISFQYCLMQDFKVSFSSNWHLFLYTFLYKIPHKFSIGFKSGDLVGQSQTSIFCFKPVFHLFSVILFSVISRTLISGVLPLCREAVSVFYSPSELGSQLSISRVFCLHSVKCQNSSISNNSV